MSAKISLKKNLVKYLVCPICRNDLSLKIGKKNHDEVLNGSLSCSRRHRFEISDGVPRFVVDKSKIFVKTEYAFSLKWKKFSKAFLHKNWYNRDKKWFLNRYGWKRISTLNKFLEDKGNILDAGTGIGNSAELLSYHKNNLVFAIDASESVNFAYKKFGNLPNVHFLQADLRQLPFKEKFFNYINSDQVLHHTTNTETSFKYLTKFLKKGGYISFYVYKKKGPIREFSDDFIRSKTVEMSPNDCLEVCKEITLLGKSLSEIKKKIRIQRDMPLLNIKAGTYDVQRFIHWNFMKCYWSEDRDFQRSLGNNFDWYYPKLAFRHSSDEVKKWCKDVKIKITNFQEIYSGISVLGKK